MCPDQGLGTLQSAYLNTLQRPVCKNIMKEKKAPDKVRERFPYRNVTKNIKNRL